ncbi:translation initiation factor IF-2 N-terminal domain-containing protein, partial [Bacillus inaquosorum]|uniref:translation initiation factor IF-2 N-terminal domain-containing protein n=1 Tax=Bacillus inaquosorum TaxID=483913 RepID=UPI00227E2528
MAKMRVYEYAKALNVSSKEILTALKNMDLEVNNHMAMLEEKAIKLLDAKYKKGGAAAKS